MGLYEEAKMLDDNSSICCLLGLDHIVDLATSGLGPQPTVEALRRANRALCWALDQEISGTPELKRVYGSLF